MKGRDTDPGLDRARRLQTLLAGLEERVRRGRQELSDYLHAEPLQGLVSAVMRLDLLRERMDDPERVVEDLDKVEGLVRHALEQVRELCYDLRSQGALGDDFDLALEGMAARMREALELEVELEIDTDRRPADTELSPVLIGTLRDLATEVRLQDGRRVAVRYGDGPDGELVLEFEAAEISRRQESAAEVGVHHVLERAGDDLGSFDVTVERRPQAVRFVVPAGLVEQGAPHAR